MVKRWLWWGGRGGAVILCAAAICTLEAKAKQPSKEYIRKRVSKEIDSHLDGKGRRAAKYQNRGFAKTGGDIYLLPHWPAYTLFFNEGDLINATFNFDTASQAYSGHGGTEDLSKLVFGEPNITIKDILLASKLASTGKLIGNDPMLIAAGALTDVQVTNSINRTKAAHYLAFLADQEVIFDASLQHYGVSLDYERAYRNGDVVVGFHIPFKMRHQRLRLINGLTPQNARGVQNVARGQNADGSPFPTDVGPGVGDLALATQLQNAQELQFLKLFGTFENFVSQILARKGISLNKDETVLGMSDVMGYVNVDFPTRYAERFMVGMSLLMPTARERDTGKLWENDLGNGGFIELSAYTSLLWQRNRWFNPHVHAKVTYGFGANVNRRVPKINEYKTTPLTTFNDIALGSGALPIRSLIILGESLNFVPTVAAGGGPDPSFKAQDSTVRNFSDGAQKVKINPGPQFYCRLGNTFDAVFSNKAFFDVFYDLRIKGKDYVARRLTDDRAQPSLLSQNTFSIAHTLGAHYSYQFSANYRAGAGLSYIIAGRNIPKTFGVDVGFNAEF